MVNIYCFHGCGQNTELFKSLLSSLQKNLKIHNWVYLRGKYYKDGGGWGWYFYKDYSSKIWDNNIEIDQNYRESDLLEYKEFITDPEDSILIGFSEGALVALDLAQYIPNIKGVIAISPAYSTGICTNIIRCPVVLITSQNDDRVMKCYSDKWKKHIENVTEVNHKKGHKVYLPLETREIIKNIYNI